MYIKKQIQKHLKHLLFNEWEKQKNNTWSRRDEDRCDFFIIKKWMLENPF